jgi:hypothetical protein
LEGVEIRKRELAFSVLTINEAKIKKLNVA